MDHRVEVAGAALQEHPTRLVAGTWAVRRPSDTEPDAWSVLSFEQSASADEVSTRIVDENEEWSTGLSKIGQDVGGNRKRSIRLFVARTVATRRLLADSRDEVSFPRLGGHRT